MGLAGVVLAALMDEYGADEETWTALRSLTRVESSVLVWLGETLAGDEVRNDIVDAIATVRDAAPRLPNDADSWDVLDAAITAVREALGVRVEGLGADQWGVERGSGLGDVGTGDTTTDGGSR